MANVNFTMPSPQEITEPPSKKRTWVEAIVSEDHASSNHQRAISQHTTIQGNAFTLSARPLPLQHVTPRLASNPKLPPGVRRCHHCWTKHLKCGLKRPCAPCTSRGILCVPRESVPTDAKQRNIIDLTSTDSDEKQLSSKYGAFVGHRSIDITFSSASSSDAAECPSQAQTLGIPKILNDNNNEVVAPKLHTYIYETPFLSASEHRHGSSNIKVVIPSRASTLAKQEVNRVVIERLGRVRGPSVSLTNDVDDSTLPSDFHFIDDYVFSQGTHRLEEEFQSGCQCPQDYRGVGCEYLKCSCLEDVGISEDGTRMGFPYTSEKVVKGLLRQKWLNTRHMIYECNDKCNCPPSCKNKVVQNGRHIPLEIFKTKNRGWGLRCPVAIKKGQFIDTYRGEIITDGEATRRELRGGKGKDSYLFSLDKFQGEEGSPDFIPNKDLYVVDGEFMGGPTRFMNHSCDPNCRQFTVSLTRGDIKVYELPFFAIEDIPAGTELTFNYIDDDDDEPVSDEKAKAITKKSGQQPVRCLCGEDNCRRYLWM